MTSVDASVRIHHPCPYCDISGEFPETLLLLWCDNRRDVFLVSSPNRSELDRVIGKLRRSFRGRPILREGAVAVLALPDFEWSTPPSVTGLARRLGVWVLHPVVYHGGTETYRLLAPSKQVLNRFVGRLRRMGDVELQSLTERTGLEAVRDRSTAAVHFFEGLTDRQARSLVAAYEGGLFEIPALGSWDAVAKGQGLSRSTFGEHLRKGELRLLRNSYAALKARAGTSERSILLPALPPGRAVPRGRRRRATSGGPTEIQGAERPTRIP